MRVVAYFCRACALVAGCAEEGLRECGSAKGRIRVAGGGCEGRGGGLVRKSLWWWTTRGLSGYQARFGKKKSRFSGWKEGGGRTVIKLKLNSLAT